MNLLTPALAAPRAVSQLLDAVASLATDVHAIRTGLEPVQDEIAVLQSEVTTIRSGLEPVQDQIAAMQQDVVALKDDAAALRRQMGSLAGQLDEVLDRMPDMKPGDGGDGSIVARARDALAS